MSTHRFSYFGGSASIRYRAVAAAEYLVAGMKAAFQMAAAPEDDPVTKLYSTYHELRKVSEDLYARYRDQFLDWQHDGRDELGDTGLFRARVDCLDYLMDRMVEKGIMKEPDKGGNLGRLRKLVTLHQFNDAATSEFRFRHALDYWASGDDDRPRSDLEKMEPVIQAVLPELAAIDVESLRSSKAAHASKKSVNNLSGGNPKP